MNPAIKQIKLAVSDYIKDTVFDRKVKLSSYIKARLPYNNYSCLSNFFSLEEGTTIQRFCREQRIEKVKELMLHDQLTLTEIAYQTGFSSVSHLSSEFKKLSGLTPSFYRSTLKTTV